VAGGGYSTGPGGRRLSWEMVRKLQRRRAATELLCGGGGRCGWRPRAGPIWARPGPSGPQSMLALVSCLALDPGKEVAAPASGSVGAEWRPDAWWRDRP
jgi:hypothetical protein